MAVTILSHSAIAKMRIAGKLAADVLTMIAPYVQAGMTTGELDRICHQYMVETLKVIPAPLNYKGFPKSICTSVNHVICHGIPGDRKLVKGDIINIDVTVIKNGYHGDTSRMFCVGEPSILARRLINVTHACLYKGIAQVAPGNYLGDIGYAIEKHAHQNRFSVVREYCGHGIHTVFHAEPNVLHYGKKGTGLLLKPGMTFTIEPMINAGKRFSKLLPDGWTVVTKDRSLSAQFEHTLLVTKTGVEVLTQRPDEEIPL